MFEGAEDVVDILIARSRERARLDSALLTDLAAVAAATPVPEFAAMEVAAALTWTRRAAEAQLELAHHLVVRLPAVHSALADGDIDLPKAKVIVDGVIELDIPTARQACLQILPDAPTLTTGQLRARLAKLVIDIDPRAAEQRHRRRVADRRAVVQPDPDGCASLCAYDLPADAAVAAANRLTQLAHAIKNAGDSRTLDQLRADTMLDLILGKPVSGAGESSRRGGVEITAPLSTLARLATAAGDLAGYGPVIADIARQVAEQQRSGQWTFTVRDTSSGRVYTGATRRRPDAETTRHVRQRDRTCRAPGCRVPAAHADIDHTVDWQAGGPTVPGNLSVLCRWHHRGKHEGGWTLAQPEPGLFTWRSPLGKIYKIRAEPPSG